jgi:hypothetical protein
MEVKHFFEMSANFQQTMRHYIPEERSLYFYCWVFKTDSTQVISEALNSPQYQHSMPDPELTNFCFSDILFFLSSSSRAALRVASPTFSSFIMR